MPGLVPGIHVLSVANAVKDVDGRDEPGHDGERVCTQISTTCPGCSATKRSCGIFSCSSAACKPTTVRVVAAIREQHRFGMQGAEENRAQPIVMRFAGGPTAEVQHGFGGCQSDPTRGITRRRVT